MPATTTSEEPTIIEQWELETTEAEVELGFACVCNDCETEMEEDDSSEGRLKCPECGLVVGFVARYPNVGEPGEPGEAVDWPVKRLNWEVEDGRATAAYFVRGRHTDCDAEFVKNAEEGQFSTADICCGECGAVFGYALSVNVLVDEKNGVNHL